MAKDVVETQNTALGIVTSIFLFVILLGVANAMLTSVLERVREIYREQREKVAQTAAELRTPHGTFGIDVVEERNEMFLSLQHSNAIVVFDKFARNKDNPKRLLQGNHTGIADPHGIAIDKKNGLLFKKAGPEGHEVAAKVLGSRKRIAAAFGTTPDKFAEEYFKRLANKGEVVEVRPGESVTLEDLVEHAREHVAGYKVPRGLVVVDKIERSPSGKPDYPWAKKTAIAAG